MDIYDNYMSKYYRNIRRLPNENATIGSRIEKRRPNKLQSVMFNIFTWNCFEKNGLSVVESLVFLTVIIMFSTFFSIILLVPAAFYQLHKTQEDIFDASSNFRVETNIVWKELQSLGMIRNKRSLNWHEIRKQHRRITFPKTKQRGRNGNVIAPEAKVEVPPRASLPYKDQVNNENIISGATGVSGRPEIYVTQTNEAMAYKRTTVAYSDQFIKGRIQIQKRPPLKSAPPTYLKLKEQLRTLSSPGALNSIPLPIGYIPFPFQKFNFVGDLIPLLTQEDATPSSVSSSNADGLLEDNSSVDDLNEDIFDQTQAATALERLIRVNTMKAHSKHTFPHEIDELLHPGGTHVLQPETGESSIIENASFGIEEESEDCRGVIGEPGDPGEDGQDGFPGPNGAPGANATIEYMEDEDGCQVCPTGPPGFVGEEGEQGDPGRSGFPGPPGFIGLDGEEPTCPGLEGKPGDIGEEGETGPPGPPGQDVFSGRGDPGPPGEEGFIGPRGTVGKPGKPVPSIPGLSGKPGPEGPPGQDGERGEVGKMGTVGVPGSDGTYCPCPRRPGIRPNVAKKAYKYSLTPLLPGKPFGLVSSENLIPKKNEPWLKRKLKKMKSALNSKAFR